MSAEKEAGRDRARFIEGAEWVRRYVKERGLTPLSGEADGEAEKRYPYPTKPRIVTLTTNMRVRFVNGALECSNSGLPTSWYKSPNKPEDIRRLADLLDRPEEPSQ